MPAVALKAAGIFAADLCSLADIVCADAEAAKHAAGTSSKSHTTFQHFLSGFA